MAKQRTKTNVTLAVAIPPAIEAALHSRAADDGVSISDVVRLALVRYLKLPKSALEMGKPGRPRAAAPD